MLARALGFSVPDYAIVEVPPELLWASFDDVTVWQTLDKNKGGNFGSVVLDGVAEVFPGSRLADEVRDRLEDLMAFDSAVLNGDRTAKKPNTLWRGTTEFFLIDHSLALVGISDNPGEETKRGHRLDDGQVRDHATFPHLAGEGRAFSRFLASWRNKISTEDLHFLKEQIPRSWEKNRDDVERIFTFLENRPEDFKGIEEQLRRVAK